MTMLRDSTGKHEGKNTLCRRHPDKGPTGTQQRWVPSVRTLTLRSRKTIQQWTTAGVQKWDKCNSWRHINSYLNRATRFLPRETCKKTGTRTTRHQFKSRRVNTTWWILPYVRSISYFRRLVFHRCKLLICIDAVVLVDFLLEYS